MNFYTPTELLDRHPELKQLWSVRAIGWLYRLGLVTGRRLKKQKTCEVSEQDILKLAEIAKERLNNRGIKTPA